VPAWWDGEETGEKRDLRRVQEFLAHREIATTAIYTVAEGGRGRAAAALPGGAVRHRTR
jgi:hypothetical protein